MIAMLYCTAYNIYVTITGTNISINLKSFAGIKASIINILKQKDFRDIIISLAATYGLYIFASFIYGSPWHMFTCLIQYILLLPFYINILMVYSLCNTHDVSWGTKGDNNESKTTETVKSLPSNEQIKEKSTNVSMETIDIAYDYLIEDLKESKVRLGKVKTSRDAATKKDDYYKLFRTNLVLFWMFSNSSLILFFTSDIWRNYVKGNKFSSNVFDPYLIFGESC